MGWGLVLCQKTFLHLLVLHFPPLFVTTIPGGGDTYWLQPVVAVAECSFHSRNTVAAGVGMVDSVGVDLQNLVGAASRMDIF